MKKFSIILIALFSVNSASAQWAYTNLSEPKSHLGATVLGNKAYFAGGENATGPLSKVEIYDVTTGAWDITYDLSVPRLLTAGVACGSKVFFAGGIDWSYGIVLFSTVDIFDTITGQWSVENLSVPRVCVAAVSRGNKVLFAGGAIAAPYVCTNVVDIYDISTGVWSIEYLSEARDARMAAVAGDLALFAGGYNGSVLTKTVDIYNFTTGLWSIDSLSVARDRMTVTTIGTRILFAGGMTSDNQRSDIVEIYDAATGVWTTANLSFPRAFSNNLCGATVCGKAFFVGGGNLVYESMPYWSNVYSNIDIYDEATNQWTTDNLTQPWIEGAVASTGNKLIIAGGFNSNFQKQKTVAILDVQSLSIPVMPTVDQFSVFPNPCSSEVTFTFAIKNPTQVILDVLNLSVQRIATILEGVLSQGEHQITWNAEELPSGIYFYRFTAGSQSYIGKIVVVR